MASNVANIVSPLRSPLPTVSATTGTPPRKRLCSERDGVSEVSPIVSVSETLLSFGYEYMYV